MGFILLMLGIFPGLLWFYIGRDRLFLTFKENADFVLYVFETNNIKYAGRVWQKINLNYTNGLFADAPKDLETIIEGFLILFYSAPFKNFHFS